MAKYSSKDLIVEIDPTDAGALQDISQHVRSINGVETEYILEESHSFGDTWFEMLQTGLRKMNPVEIGGIYDDTASTAPNAIFNGTHAVTRTLKITWGGTKTTTVEVWIQKYTRSPELGGFTKYSVTLQPTGSVTEA